MRVYYVFAFYEFGDVFATGEHCVYSTRKKAEAKINALIKEQERPSLSLDITRGKNKVILYWNFHKKTSAVELINTIKKEENYERTKKIGKIIA